MLIETEELAVFYVERGRSYRRIFRVRELCERFLADLARRKCVAFVRRGNSTTAVGGVEVGTKAANWWLD